MLKKLLLLALIFVPVAHKAIPVKHPWKAAVDSIKKVSVLRRKAKADSIKSTVVPVVYSVEYADTLLQQIDHLHATLNNITNESKYGFKTGEIRKDLQTMKATLGIISESLGRDSSVMSMSNLQMFQILLKDMEEKLHEWKLTLYDDSKDLIGMSAEMNVFTQDSFTQKVAADTAFARLHLDEMLILNERWNDAQKTTNAKLARISTLQAEVSSSYFDVIELQNKVADQLTGSWKKSIAKESNFIWDAYNSYTLSEVTSFTAQSFWERMSVLKYYLTLNYIDWLSVILLGLVYFFWLFWNFRKLRIAGDADFSGQTFKYIRPLPILSTLIFTLSIAPFYGFSQPALYIQILQLFLLFPLTVVLWRIWDKQLLICWFVLIMLFFSMTAMNAIITPGRPLRLFILCLNLSAIILGLRFIYCYNKDIILNKIVKYVAVLFIFMNLLSLFTNISGRLTFTKILTTAAITGLTQIISLFVLIPMLTEAFYLQMKGRRLSGGMVAKFNYQGIQSGLFQLLSAGAFILWLITFTTNLDIYAPILSFLDVVVNTRHEIGSTYYTIGNIFTFIIVLYFAYILQKYIGYFFGETDDDIMGDLDKKESRMVIFRLVIIIAGFGVAIVASGLPVDKVTVVLGALGVGIGLGLQNIVYNLVSGVILVFEKPMQIGDYIEVADKKGRVHSIGIRSSTLVTSDGSEIVVPNGDILSSHMVNWTRGNNNRRAELIIKIEPATELETAKQIILETLKADKQVIPERPVDILISELSEHSVQISINVWISSIYKEQEFKSEVLSNIYTSLAAKGIKIV